MEEEKDHQYHHPMSTMLDYSAAATAAGDWTSASPPPPQPRPPSHHRPLHRPQPAAASASASPPSRPPPPSSPRFPTPSPTSPPTSPPSAPPLTSPARVTSTSATSTSSATSAPATSPASSTAASRAPSTLTSPSRSSTSRTPPTKAAASPTCKRRPAYVLAALDHPFLPTLYAIMDASHYACFLIDYCPGGDLHSLLARCHRLPLPAVRFFAAEVLLALQYLHALGFVYRDLKPENVLLRADGHIMLSDFDLCFSADHDRPSAPRLHRLRLQKKKNKETTQEETTDVVAEPEGAFSRACVGTHEYLAPEIVSGAGHGTLVDWWAFRVFVYELMYGRTPFKGPSKEATLKNILSPGKELRFPGDAEAAGDDEVRAARDMIQGLLARDPRERLGRRRGAAEIMRHPFFEGVKWSLMRCAKPPVVVGPAEAVVVKDGGLRRRRRRSAGGWWPSGVEVGLVVIMKGSS